MRQLTTPRVTPVFITIVTLCLALLPYFLAAQLLSGENEDLAAWFLQRYREALQDLKGKLPGEFEPISTPYGLF